MKRVLTVLCIFLAFAALCFAALVVFVCYQEVHVPPAEDYDAIVVLGAQVKADGTPSVQLAYRLEKALETYLRNPRMIVTAGAQGADEPMAEADFMRGWLIEKGVPQEHVLSENQSLNTRQNLKNAMALLDGQNVQKILIVTSDYHLPRAIALARDEGVTATGVGSPSKNDVANWSRNHFREALAWAKYWVEKYTGVRIAW